MYRPNKIFIGLVDIASMIGDLTRAFSELGIETLTAMQSSTVITLGKSDFVIENQLPDLAWFEDQNMGEQVRQITRHQLYNHIWKRAIAECDTFIFLWSSFMPDYSDFIELKKMGKKIIVYLVGSDIRWKPITDQEFAYYGIPPMDFDDDFFERITLESRLHYLRMVERFADVVISYPSAMQLSLRPYNKYWIPIDLPMFTANPAQRKRPLVIHAPSKRDVKGTKYVLPVFERLKQEGVEFDVQLIENMPYTEAIRAYQNADILVGQLMIPGCGKQELELLACGKVVLSSIRHQYPQINPPDCPMIDVSPENLYDELKAIILDHPRRIEMAKQARSYVVRYHDTVRIGERILDLLKDDSPQPDHYPSFFRDHYVPESSHAIEICNAYTNFVKDEPWYRAHVRPGQRAGLIF